MVSMRMGTWSPLLLLAVVVALAALAAAEELRIDPENVERWHVRPGDWVSVDLGLCYDDGAASETAVVDVFGDPEGWPFMLKAIVGGEVLTSSGPLALTVRSGTVVTVTLTTNVPGDANSGWHGFRLKAYLWDRPGVECTAGIDVQVDIVTGASLSLLDPGQALVSVRPGDTVELTLVLTNDGNYQDRFQMVVSSKGPGSTWQAFWSEGVGSDEWTPFVSAHALHALRYTVWVPMSGYVGESVYLTFVALSSSDPATTHPSVCATVGCGLSGALEVSSLFPDQNLDPFNSLGGWDTLEGAVQVNNAGNGADKVTVDGYVLGLTEAGLATFRSDPSRLDLAQSSSGTFRVYLDVSRSTPAEHYFLDMRFRSTDPSVLVTDRISFWVSPATNLSLTAPRPVRVAVPGDLVQFDLAVENTGNCKSTVDLTVTRSPAGWAAEVRPGSLTLEQGVLGQAVLMVSLPDMWSEPLLESYSIEVMAALRPGVLRFLCDVAVQLEDTYRVEWSVGGRIVTGQDAAYAPSDALGEMPCINPFGDDPDWESTDISVVNLGNVGTNFSLSPWSTSPSFDVVFDPPTAFLPPGGWMMVAVDLTAKHDLEPGAYVVTLAIHCPDAPSFLTRVLPVHLNVFLVDVAVRSPVAVYIGDVQTSIMGTLDVEQATTVMLEATIRNLCPTPVEGVEVVLTHTAPSGMSLQLDRATVHLSPTGHTKVTFNWTAYVTGHHELTVEARLPDQARTDNDAVRVVVEVHARDVGGDEEGSGPIPREVAAFAAMAVAVLVFVLWRARGGPRGKRRPPKQPRQRRVIALQARPWDDRPEDR